MRLCRPSSSLAMVSCSVFSCMQAMLLLLILKICIGDSKRRDALSRLTCASINGTLSDATE